MPGSFVLPRPELPRLQQFVEELQSLLYCDSLDGSVDPDCEWSSDTLASLAELMDRYRLAPRRVGEQRRAT